MGLNIVNAVIQAFFQGFIDSLRGFVSIFYLDTRISEKAALEKQRRVNPSRKKTSTTPSNITQGKILKRILQCGGLNGGVFWLSLIIFDYILLPALNALLMYVLGYSNIASTVWSWSMPLLYGAFGTFWILPLFGLSRIVNLLWFQDIADSAFWCVEGRSNTSTDFGLLIADILFSIVIQTLFLIQATVVSLFPVHLVGMFFSTFHMCLLYSLYAFEYKWFKLGWELHHRLLFIENNWSYFVGFGLPLSILTALPQSYFARACVFSMLFPLFIISANEAKPVTGVCKSQLQLFSLVISLSNAIFNLVVKRTTNKTSTPEKKSSR